MPVSIAWTERLDALICGGRKAGQSWGEIADAAGLSRSTVIERARRLGIPVGVALASVAEALPEADTSDRRRPLPPGAPESWGALAALTPSLDRSWPG